MNITANQIQNKIDANPAFRTAFYTFREHAQAEELVKQAEEMGFGAHAGWNEQTGGIEIGYWAVRIYNKSKEV